jgi:uncharacterized cupin superfamily protein
MEHPIEPGRLVLPHVHLHEDEYSYVLERDDQYESRGPRGRRGAGQLSDQAPRAMHTFWNAGPGSVWQRNTGAYSLVWVAELTSKFDLKLLG